MGQIASTGGGGAMKAYRISYSDLPRETGIYAAQSASKAKHHVALVLQDCGYERRVGDAFLKLKCKRCPEFDTWAADQSKPTGITQEGAEDWIQYRGVE